MRNIEMLIENINSQSERKKTYLRRIITSLRRKSSDKYKHIGALSTNDMVIEMLKEWIFIHSSSNIREVNGLNCELCNHPDTIYQYRIKNTKTDEAIWTGSSCILNFSIDVSVDGKILDKDKDKEAYFRGQVADIKDTKRKSAILDLIQSINVNLPENEISFVPTEKNVSTGVYSMKQILLITRLYHIAFDEFIPTESIELFKISFRIKKNKEAFEELEYWQICQLFPIVSKSILQKEEYFPKEKRRKCYIYLGKNSPFLLKKLKRMLGKDEE